MQLIVTIAGVDQHHELSEGATVLGRDHSCDIRIDDPSLSRRHIECVLQHGELTVRDLNTKNGTYVGGRQILEAKVKPGVRVRAATLWLRFEEEPQPQEQPPGPAAASPPPLEPEVSAPPPPLPDLEREVPVDDAYDEDEAPTPLDDTVVPETGLEPTDDGTRLVVRDGRWFVRDLASGVEVEIVPVQGDGQGAAPAAGQESPASPSANLPAVIPHETGLAVPGAQPPMVRPGEPRTPEDGPARRRRRLLIVGAAALVAVLAAVLLLLPVLQDALFPPDDADALLDSRQYRALVTSAALEFKNGNRQQAANSLRAVMARRMRGEPVLAEILLEAIELDNKAEGDFRAVWEKTQDRWKEVRRSSESTEEIREIASLRLKWFSEEADNMIHITEAGKHIDGGNLEGGFERAARVPERSLFRAEAEDLIVKAKSALITSATKKAAEAEKAKNWVEAIGHLAQLIKYEPARASELNPKIAKFRQYENHRLAVGKAKALAAQKKFSQAASTLKAIPADSPYAAVAKPLIAQHTRQQALQGAAAAYHGGDGKGALKQLATAGLEGSATARKIQAVLQAYDRAVSAEKQARLYEAMESYRAILSLESSPNNFYAKTAKSKLADMPKIAKIMADQLTREAVQALRKGSFKVARDKYNEARLLDPTNANAIKGIERLKKDAIRDYNGAMWTKDLEKAIVLLQNVMDRLPPTDKYFRLADQLKRQKEAELEKRRKKPAPPAPEAPPAPQG